MAGPSQNGHVIAYYTPPEGPVERHEMWPVDYDDAKRSAEGDCWSLMAPEEGTEIEDHVPKPIVIDGWPNSKPPPVMPR